MLKFYGVECNVLDSPIEGLGDELAVADRTPLINLIEFIIVNFDPNAIITDHVFAFGTFRYWLEWDVETLLALNVLGE